MSSPDDQDRVTSERFIRLDAIEGWDLDILVRARILVVGAGALGNEVVKNLSLLGVGNLVIVDFDHVEISNLTRSVLFREHHCGQEKATCAAAAARDIHPGSLAAPLAGNILSDVGLGYFRWADVVIGALDNREARVFVNAACARVGTPWLDGGIDVFSGIARGFGPPDGACYECTMSERDWQLLQQRKSCTLLGQDLEGLGVQPTTPTAASIIGGIQVQEAVKILHGDTGFLGRGFVFDGKAHNSYPVQYDSKPLCPRHEPPSPVLEISTGAADTILAEIVENCRNELGGCDGLEFGHELVLTRNCPACGIRDDVLKAAPKAGPEDLVCPECGGECLPGFAHGLAADSPYLERTVHDLGLPAWDIVWARRGERYLGFELAGDRP